ncbi:MAG TPA: hypothetical protein VGI40_08155 [Pirellulaceae bacterium]|jgi:hypothetical protein
MSIASLGILGGLATTAGAQRAADTQRVDTETTDQSRAVTADEHAENAAGIGQTEEDASTTDRDADGRRLWENTRRKKTTAAATASTTDSPLPPISKDPTGACGNQLDLVG